MAGSTVARAKVILEADDRGLKRGLSSAEKSFKHTTSGINKNLDDLEEKNHKVSKALGTALKAGAVAAGAGLVAVAVGAKKAVDAASDLGEQMNKTNVVFRKGAKEVLAFSKTTASSLGISQRAALEAAGTFGNMLVPMGFARKEAAGMSTRMVKLAADMASFNNASPEETLEALRAGLAGETEPLRKFGVFLNDARLKQEALNLGIYSGTGTLDAATKAQATYSLILKDSKDAAGDFERTSGSLANQQRILKAELENAAASVGKVFLPAVTKVLQGVTQLIPKLQQWGSELFERLKPALNQVVAIVERNWPAIQKAFEQVGQTLIRIAEQIGPPLLKFFRELATLVVRTFQQIGQILADHQKDLETIARVVGVTLVQAWKSWREAMEPTLRVAVQLLGPLITGLARVLAAINALLRPIGGLQTAFRIMIMATIGLIPNLILHWDRVKGVLVAIRDTIVGGITRAVNGLRTVFANVTGFVLGLLSKMLGALGSITGALAKAAGWVPKIGDKFKEADRAIKDAKRSVDDLRGGITKVKPKEVNVKVKLSFTNSSQRGGGGGGGGASGPRTQGAHGGGYRAITSPANFDKTVDAEMVKTIQEWVDNGIIGSPAPGLGAGPPSAQGGNYVWPAGSRSIWGTPLSGTHTLGNWQSDRALDIGGSAGTPVYASISGTASGYSYGPDDGGRFGGSSVYVGGRDNTWYKHLSSVYVKGGFVKAGTMIGRMGRNSHVHYAEYAGPLFGYGAHLAPGAHAHSGGYIPGRRPGDRIPLMVEEGEFVMSRAAVDQYGVGTMHALNKRQVRGLKAGGDVYGGEGGKTPMTGGGQPTSSAGIGQQGGTGQVDPYMTLKARYPGWSEQQIQDWLVQFGSDPAAWPNPGGYFWDIEYGWLTIGTNRSTLKGEPLHPIDKTVPEPGGSGDGTVGTNPPGGGGGGDDVPDGTVDDPVNVRVNPQDVRDAFDNLKKPIPTEEQGPCPTELAAQLAFQNRRTYASDVFGSGAEAVSVFGHQSGTNLGISKPGPKTGGGGVTINNYFNAPPDDQFAFIKRNRFQVQAALG